MTSLEIGLVIISAVLFAALIIVSVLYIRNKKGIEKLSQKTDAFLNNGEKIGISTQDNSLAQLQNSIADLENRLILERDNTVSQSKRNADFIADVSHQLKTPLAGLKLYCEMQQTQDENSYAQKQLQLVVKMESLVKSLLKLEKLRSDAYTMEFAEQRAENIIGELVSEFRHLFPNKNITVSGEAVMRCDKQWLSEAVGNIIKNAGEHTAENGKVDIKIEQTDASTVITVEDNGGGIPSEELQKIFGRFYRTSNAAADSAGIGMSISKAIVEKHHGTIFAENGKEGLKVTICLPRYDGGLKI